MEIEKKFLIQSLPEGLEQYEKKVMEQGYLCSNPVVRIRKSNEKYILTYKARIGKAFEGLEGQMEDTRINHEVEVPLNQSGYEHLREKIDGSLVKKCRYLVPLPDGHMGELDVFDGVLKGLCFIEVEFADETDANEFEPPAWFGKNVSGDGRYSNSFLSGCKDLSAFAPEEILLKC